MTDPSPRSRATPAPTLLRLTTGVVVATAAAVAVARGLHDLLPTETLRTHGALVVVGASGLFLASAALRWATYLLQGRSDVRVRALVATLAAFGLVPLHLWTHGLAGAGGSPDQLALLGAGRVLVAVLVVTLLVLAMARPRRHDRLRVIAAASWLVAGALLVLGLAVSRRPEMVGTLLSALAVLTAATWGAAAGYAAHRTDTRPWARGLTPLLLLMAVTELLTAIDPQASGPGATASTLIIVALAVVSVGRSLADLRSAVADERRRSEELERDLVATRDDLVLLQQRERRLTHDARGTLAGVRAAMQIWAATAVHDLSDDDSGSSTLRQVALREVERLEHALRQHRVELGCGPVALDVVVDRAARSAFARGAEIKIDVPRLVVLGQATDLELAVREVIDRCLLLQPSQRLEVSAEREAGAAVLVLRRPTGRPTGRPSPTRVPVGRRRDGIDALEHAAHLLRRTGGSLLRDPDDGALRVVVPLCPAPRLVPRQRRSPDDRAPTDRPNEPPAVAAG